MTITSPRMRRLKTTARIATAALILQLSAIAHADDTEAPRPVFYNAQSATSFAGALLAGQMAATTNDLDTAIAYFRRALQYVPNDTGTNDQLFIALIFNGDIEGAIAQAEKTSNNPQLNPLRNLSLGLSALSHGNYDDALTKFDNFDGSELDLLVAELLKAWTLYGKGHPDKALAMIDELDGPPWYDLFANYNAGSIAALAGETAKARTYFNDALLDREGGLTAPDTILRTVLALAELEQKAGNHRKALDTISVAEMSGINSAVLDPIRKRIEANEPLIGIPDSATAGASGVLFQIAAALNQGDGDDIVSLYLALADALTPNQSDVLYLLGTTSISKKRPQKALAYFKRIAPQTPQYRLAKLQQGLVLAELGRTDEAVTELEAMIDSAPADRRGYLALSSILSSEEDFASMAVALDKAIEQIGPVASPEDWGIFYRRGIAYERLKEWDKAEPYFHRALELYPNQPQVLNYLGYSWIDRGIKFEEGLDLIQQAVDQRPDDGYIIDSLGWAYYRLGRFDDAVRELQRAVELDTGDPTIGDHLGDAYWQVGRKLEAIYQWNKSLAADPGADLVPVLKNKIAYGLHTEADMDEKPLVQTTQKDGSNVKTP